MMLPLRRVQGSSGPAKSGNRPRFKQRFGGCQDSTEDDDDDEDGGISTLNQPAPIWRPLTLIQVTLLVVMTMKMLVATANCDYDNSNSFDRLDLDSLKVAALATKLEHWFVCRQANALSIANSELSSLDLGALSEKGHLKRSAGDNQDSSSSSSPAGSRPATSVTSVNSCRTHYDGHLCWPATKQGQSAKLPCPRLNWLPNEQQQQQPADHSVKSVISSIQTSTQANNSTAESIKQPASSSIIATQTDLTGFPITTTTTTNAPITQQADANKQQQQQG